MKIVIISRKKWARGQIKKYGDSSLLNDKGNMCCLGFVAKSCGVPLNTLKGIASYATLIKGSRKLLPKKLRPFQNGWDNTLTTILIGVNDNKISAKLREQRIIELFKEANIQIRFRD